MFSLPDSVKKREAFFQISFGWKVHYLNVLSSPNWKPQEGCTLDVWSEAFASTAKKRLCHNAVSGSTLMLWRRWVLVYNSATIHVFAFHYITSRLPFSRKAVKSPSERNLNVSLHPSGSYAMKEVYLWRIIEACGSKIDHGSVKTGEQDS